MLIRPFLLTFASMKRQESSEYIHFLIAQGEHQQQDFKFEISDARKIAKTLSAFANTDGGRLLIGVKDNGKIAGVACEEEQYMIQAAAEQYCKPGVTYSMQTYCVNGKNVLLVEIAPNEKKPVYAQDDNGKFWAYVRVADENILASPVHLQMWRQTESIAGELVAFSEREQHLLQLLQQYDTLSLNACCRKIDLSRKAVEQLLAKLIRYEIVEPMFDGQQFHFRLK